METKASIDDTQRDDSTTPPDVRIRSYVCATGLLVEQVMSNAGDWLEQESSDNDETDDRVVSVQLLRHHSNPDTHTHGSQNYDIGRDHPSCVKPDDAFEAQESDYHSSYWEEEDESDGSEDRMGHDNHVHITWSSSIAAT